MSNDEKIITKLKNIKYILLYSLKKHTDQLGYNGFTDFINAKLQYKDSIQENFQLNNYYQDNPKYLKIEDIVMDYEKHYSVIKLKYEIKK